MRCRTRQHHLRPAILLEDCVHRINTLQKKYRAEGIKWYDCTARSWRVYLFATQMPQKLPKYLKDRTLAVRTGLLDGGVNQRGSGRSFET